MMRCRYGFQQEDEGQHGGHTVQDDDNDGRVGYDRDIDGMRRGLMEGLRQARGMKTTGGFD